MEINDPSVPPGFRFHPTEEELVGYYLSRKINSLKIDLDVIVDIDLYKMEPWDIQDKCNKLGCGSNDHEQNTNSANNEWYFFSHKDKKYPTGTRTNRATAAGFWKATGRDKAVMSKDNKTMIGMRKTLVFYEGRAPNGKKSDWIMHEYRLQNSQDAPPQEEGWVVCKVFRKPSPSSSQRQYYYGLETYWNNNHNNINLQSNNNNINNNIISTSYLQYPTHSSSGTTTASAASSSQINNSASETTSSPNNNSFSMDSNNNNSLCQAAGSMGGSIQPAVVQPLISTFTHQHLQPHHQKDDNYHHNQYFNHMSNYSSCSMTLNQALDRSSNSLPNSTCGLFSNIIQEGIWSPSTTTLVNQNQYEFNNNSSSNNNNNDYYDDHQDDYKSNSNSCSDWKFLDHLLVGSSTDGRITVPELPPMSSSSLTFSVDNDHNSNDYYDQLF